MAKRCAGIACGSAVVPYKLRQQRRSQLGPHKGGPGPHVGPETDRGSVPANFAEPPSGYAASG
jgi:hypothetical protein